MGKRKLFNDPIYGLINFNDDFVYDIINHPFFQRLRRISQMGLSHYVYPGATHSRFQHAIGACYLTQSAMKVLREKGIAISDEEFQGTCLAVLLHDIGHGPFSHALEERIIEVSHESITLSFIDHMNKEYEGKLSLAKQIFEGSYHRPFLTQLVSGQLDMDRMDYLMRDSYYTGVAEGIVGYDRIISMLNVVEDQLVVEEKGLYSVQKFLLAREIMYKQVYLHKTSLVVEQMLKRFFDEFKLLIDQGCFFNMQNEFLDLLKSPHTNQPDWLLKFAALDDSDIVMLLKESKKMKFRLLKEYGERILNRNLFKIVIDENPISSDLEDEFRQKVRKFLKKDESIENFIFSGKEVIKTYDPSKDEILLLKKNGTLISFSEFFPNYKQIKGVEAYYLCYRNDDIYL